MVAVSGTLNNLEDKVKQFLNKLEKIPFDNYHKWEPYIQDFFSKEPFVFWVTALENTKEELKEIENNIAKYYFSDFNEPLWIFDTDDLYKSLIKMKESMDMGEGIDAYYKFLFNINFFYRKNFCKVIDHEDSKFNDMCGQIKIQNWEWGKANLHQKIWIIVPDSTVQYPYDKYFEEISGKFDKLIKKAISKEKNKKNKKVRDPIESRLRHEVFKRDDYRCLECGKTKTETTLHVDHIIPVSQGGTDELENLQTLCQACNLAKTNRAWKAGDNNGK